MQISFAPAKINLYLHVTGKRADGYHLLDSLAAFASVGDTLEVTPAPKGSATSLTLTGPFAASLPKENASDNLVLRTLRLFAEEADLNLPPLSITLEKCLPVASGIGGGSADAAAMLTLLSSFCGNPLSQEKLLELAARLGADVPVCMLGERAYMSGIGEAITPAPLFPPLPAILVNPAIPLSTPEVFRARSGDFSAPHPRFSGPSLIDAAIAWLGAARNDLEPAAISCVPAIAEVLEAISAEQDCHIARMSGSGATCFGLFTNIEAAEKAASRLQAHYPAWWVVACVL